MVLITQRSCSESKRSIQFSMAGFGIGLSKGLAETKFKWQPFFERLFPALLIALGALLMVYAE